MVWGLFPSDPLPGEDKYYIFSKGTYKVGRRGCDVIVNKDKGVSRIHAEIVVDAMVSLDPALNTSSNVSNVRIRDCSKYGTFIKQSLGSKEKVQEEATLKDGDHVTFGTGTATYRFCSVPFIVVIHCLESFKARQLLQEKLSSIGACMSSHWRPDCTHVLVDEFTILTEAVIDAFVAKKPFILKEWVEVVAEKNICTEVPSTSSYAPTLMLEGVSVKVAEPKSRENCLRGYSFLLEPIHQYKFKDKLRSLLEMVGGKVVSVEGFRSISQGFEDEEETIVVLVIPHGSSDNLVSSRNLSSFSRARENDLVCAAFCGHLDPSIMVAAPVVVSSSCSTDETVVADSDLEEEAMSIPTVGVNALRETETIIALTENAPRETETITARTENTLRETETIEDVSMKEPAADYAVAVSESATIVADHVYRSNRVGPTMGKGEQIDELERGNVDIIFSQSLIVRDINVQASVCPSEYGVPNFKRFRKARSSSGNSFQNLVPFSKHPYSDTDYGNEVVESVKEEKKRKQMEAVSEDLFNNEKGRKRGVAGSLRGLYR